VLCIRPFGSTACIVLLMNIMSKENKNIEIDFNLINKKLEYYKKRDGFMLNVKDTYTNWKMGDPTQPTHGGGTVTKFSKKHPKEVQEII